MKKFITTLILSLLSVLCVFAFTACGGNEKEKEPEKEPEVKTTVTEEEWKAALKVMCPQGATDEEMIANANKINFVCNMQGISDNETIKSQFKCDYAKKTFYLNYELGWGEEVAYYWEGANGIVYGSDGNENKTHADQNINLIILSNAEFFCGGAQFIEFEIIDNYNKFTYEENDKTYSAKIGEGEDAAEFVLKFADGYVVEASVNLPDESMNYTYEYNTNYTVPKDILDIPVKKD